jgi:3-oxoacyl-[acyl-carrier protein] reductase
VVNIGGMTASTGAAGRAHVVTAKAALEGLTRALAHEFAPHGITVNCVSPGLVDTVRSGAPPRHHAGQRHAAGPAGQPARSPRRWRGWRAMAAGSSPARWCT